MSTVSSSTSIAPLPPTPSASSSSSSSYFSNAVTSASNKALWFLPGAVQGATTVLLGHPFDTAKTRLQADTALRLQTRSSVRVMQQMVRREGAMSLYRGVTPPLAIMGSKRGLQFALWEQLKKKKGTDDEDDGKSRGSGVGDNQNHSFLLSARHQFNKATAVVAENNFLSGALSGAFGTILGCPMHVIKIQTQNVVAETGTHWNAFYCTKKILREDGVRGLYRGLKFHVLKDTFFAGTYLGMYEKMRVELGAYERDHHHQSSGAAAGMAANLSHYFGFARAAAPSSEMLSASAPSAAGAAALTLEQKKKDSASASLTSSTSASVDTRHRTSNLTIFTAGVLASCFTWVVLYPLDTLKTAVQARNAVSFASFLQMMAANPFAVYRGFSAALIRAGPVSGGAMVGYETTKRWVHGSGAPTPSSTTEKNQ